ncbi:MAG: M24 family metallopeptidase [Fimbriimonadaceae bacterium]
MEQARIAALAGKLRDAGIDAFLAWSETSLAYLHDYHEHAGHRFLTLGVSSNGHVALICGALSENQARRAGIADVRGWRDGEDPLALMSALAAEWNLRTAVVAVDEDMPALMLLKLQGILPAALFKDGGPLLADLRRRKTPEELALMREAAKIADDTYDEVKPRIKAGMTERQIERMLFDGMERRGGRVNFGIVGAGSNGAEPHHATDDTVVKSGDVVILDFGCDVQGYRSDITRTVSVGRASPKACEVYRVVYAAHIAGRKKAVGGVTCGAADAAARAVIEQAGYGKQFMHRLGHGIGLQGHEMPYLMPHSEVVLEAGDCYSVEPGIYVAGEFGVRIENILTATPGGNESFNAEPSAELEAVG